MPDHMTLFSKQTFTAELCTCANHKKRGHFENIATLSPFMWHLTGIPKFVVFIYKVYPGKFAAEVTGNGSS